MDGARERPRRLHFIRSTVSEVLLAKSTMVGMVLWVFPIQPWNVLVKVEIEASSQMPALLPFSSCVLNSNITFLCVAQICLLAAIESQKCLLWDNWKEIPEITVFLCCFWQTSVDWKRQGAVAGPHKHIACNTGLLLKTRHIFSGLRKRFLK